MADVQYYTAPVNVRQTAGTSSGTTIWSMRNAAGSGKTIIIENISLNMDFDSATPITRALLRYDFMRFSSATPTGGTSVSAVALDSNYVSSAVTDIRFLDTGLTVSGLSFTASLLTIGVPATDSAVVNYSTSNLPVTLNPGEGLCIKLNTNSVAGQGMTGFITWSER